jgi:hypothetical protein
MDPYPSFINIRPSARILRILGDIEFEPWQCLAELIDNAFDDFLELERTVDHWPDGYRVSVSLPRANTQIRDAEVVIQDSGRGMDLTTLNNAVRAGWSSNDRFSKLGLFGMGFNIATARLGKRARVLTTRAGDPEWVGVEIDLNSIGDDFEAPVIVRPKVTASEHGTIVEVDRLDPDRSGWLGRNNPKIRATLGDVYAYLLDKTAFELFVNGVKVKPKRACIWSEQRSVTYGRGSTAEQIPAVKHIDERLPDADACLACGNWQPPGAMKCTDCGSDNIAFRERRIWGWLGVQRYLHKTEFGVDFLRNGRKILRYDKRIFEWVDPNDPLGTPELEYPIELGQGGRLVGEIHLDHVPVNYQKNAFEWSDRSWIAAVRYLRGEGPLLPQRAKQLGYPPNESILALLHRGFRRNDPGYRCLVPGNGQGPIHTTTLEWRDKFHSGEAEFQTDEKWWQAIVLHETSLSGNSTTSPESGDVLSELGLNTPPSSEPHSVPSEHSGSSVAIPSRETEKERLERLKNSAVHMPGLSKSYGLVEFGATIEVEVLLVNSHEVRDSRGFRTPVLVVQDRGRHFLAFVDALHPVFRDFADDPADYLAIELVHHLRTRADHDMPLSQGVALLKDRQLSDLKVDPALLAAQAREVLGIVREGMVNAVTSDPARAWQFLSSDERAVTETNLVLTTTGITLSELQHTGEFIHFAPAIFLPRLLEEWPEAFMDGVVFRGGYLSVSSGVGRRVTVGRVVGYLYDAALAADAKASGTSQLAKCRLSLQLLRDELARAGEDTEV